MGKSHTDLVFVVVIFGLLHPSRKLSSSIIVKNVQKVHIIFHCWMLIVVLMF